MFKKLAISTACVAVSLLLGGAGVLAGQRQANSNANSKTGAYPVATDQDFARTAAQGSIAEVRFGQLAEEKGATPQVRDFGRLMVFDHSKADSELKDVANQDHIRLPITMSPEDQAEYQKLSKLSPSEFDHAYAREMVREHQQDIRQFKMEAKDGSNSAIKLYAAKTAPILEEHLRLAEGLQQT